MDEKTAWNMFCQTGKIQDYINYSNIKNSEIYGSGGKPAPVNLRDLDAGKNRGTHY